MKFIDQVDIQGKKLLIRVDFNVPLKEGQVVDDSRIQSSLETIQFALSQGACVILCAHLGSPKGQVKPELSLRPVQQRLQSLLGLEVLLAKDCIGPDALESSAQLRAGQVLLLENIRFHPGETKNDLELSKKLASLAQVYVNDAFGVSHRSHASVVGVTQFAKVCCAGLLMKKEWSYLTQVNQNPARPSVAITGGAKVSSKLGILKALIQKFDRVIIGGAMANTFLKSLGYEVGKSLVEEDLLQEALMILEAAKSKGVSVYLPVDFITGKDIASQTATGVFPFQNVPKEDMILDTGPATHALFAEVIRDAKSVVWNGPMGAFENPAFSQGSVGLAHFVASKKDALTIVGGGDTDALIHRCGLAKEFSFISTGGGAFLEFLEGKDLPAFQALKECAGS